MNKVQPITPKELDETLEKSFPEAVIMAFNQLLKENYRGKGSVTIQQKDVINLILKLDESLSKNVIFDKKYLDVEPLYRKHGWKVKYESPDRDENFDSFFVFSV